VRGQENIGGGHRRAKERLKIDPICISDMWNLGGDCLNTIPGGERLYQLLPGFSPDQDSTAKYMCMVGGGRGGGNENLLEDAENCSRSRRVD